VFDIHGRGSDFIRHRVQTDSGVHVVRGSFPKNKADHSLPSSVQIKNP
jgi:hypothetical protein